MINRYTWRTLTLEAALAIAALITMIPIIGLVNVSFKDQRNNSEALVIAGNYTLENYATAWREGFLGAAIANTVFITTVSVAVIVLIGAFTAYPIARIGQRWSRWVFYLFLLGLVIPAQLGLLPLYRAVSGLGLVGTPWSVILLAIGGGMPFTVFIFTTFLRESAREYEEAALIDGCGPVLTFVHIVFPLLRPAIGTVAILNALAIWNDFFVPLLYLSGSGQETVQVRIHSFVGQYTANYPVIFAALTLTSIPILLAYLFLQKNIIQGFAGGVKG
ncbi:carbohydrate ABC transporter permease [Psychromicrobium xiongbiense]|uniref:carbohydrate ABC transporter permease n=1 Tax=Psychromicrobium xiongbiense TaxID=3051184 RepID=UPI0025533172|nr:carbohydrate ABC transporter permease [Psychromicrobium sp. YIM S02556]